MTRARAITVVGLACLLAPLLTAAANPSAAPAAAVPDPTTEALRIANSLAGPGAEVTGAGWDTDHDPGVPGNEPLTKLSSGPDPLPPCNGDVTCDDYLSDNTSAAASAVDTGLDVFPRSGPDFAVLATGPSEFADDPQADLASLWYQSRYQREPADAPDHQAADRDVTVLRVDLDVPATANCLTLDFKFFSEEHPEFSDTGYNDAFVAELDSSHWYTHRTTTNDPVADFVDVETGPTSFAHLPGPGQPPVTVNAAFGGAVPDEVPTGLAADTVYGGATPLLTAATPVTPGPHSVYLSIFDSLDRLLDSAVFMDNLTVGSVDDPASCAIGAQVKAFDFTLTPPSATVGVGDVHTVDLALSDLAADDPAVADTELLATVQGANPQTHTVTTDDDGHAQLSWVGVNSGTDTVTACADIDSNGSCDPDEPVTSATADWVAPPVDQPRLAFTDETDRLFEVEIESEGDEYVAADPEPYAIDGTGPAARPEHQGEAGGTPDDEPALVSTRHNQWGEVYLASPEGPPTRVTCDEDVETHPVVDDSGTTRVAYASNADGDWDIYVSSAPEPVPVPVPAVFTGRATAVPASAAAATACDPTWTTVNVTDESDGTAYDDLWPTWTADGELVFSRAAPAALSDLYLVGPGDGAWLEPEPLTSSPRIAESQPAATELEEVFCDPPGDPDCFSVTVTQTWVAFTTTRRRGDGSVGLLATDDSGAVFHADLPRNATEPAWSDATNPTHLAYTSTAEDPYGDIRVAEVAPPDYDDDCECFAAPDLSSAATVVGARGVAESHAHWLDDFVEDEARLVYTSRYAEHIPGLSLTGGADVSDVLAVDGDQRRVIRRDTVVDDGELLHRYDEAGPSYSPDGGRIVYSRDAFAEEETGGARVLMTADADGTDPAPLLPDGQRLGSDLDTDPVWSPDGTRIAFVRVRGAGGGEPNPQPPEIWVYDLTTEVATRVPGTAGADLHPSWSPDSRRLAIGRTDPAGPVGAVGAVDGARRLGPGPDRASRLWIVDAADPLAAPVRLRSCAQKCRSVPGREPSWSPDGRTVVYVHAGHLQSVTLQGACCTDTTAEVSVPVALTGFASDGTPTPSRPVISTADDPDWSPDGAEIAFAGQPAGQPDQRGIWAIAPDGSGLRRITDDRGPDTEPAWQRRRADVAVAVAITGSPALPGAPVTATYTVTNLGPWEAPATTLTTTFAAGAVLSVPVPPTGCLADGTGCAFGTLAPGEARVYEVRLQHPQAVSGLARGVVTSAIPDPNLANNQASAAYRVDSTDLTVKVRLDDVVGYVGGLRMATFTVRNRGTGPTPDASLTATWPALVDAVVDPATVPSPPGPEVLPPTTVAPECLALGDPCLLGGIEPDGRRRFTVLLWTPTEGTAVLTAEVETSAIELSTTNNIGEAGLEILQPTIRVLPAVSPPGKVVLVYGENMPPGSDVTLEWASGINIHTGPFEVSEDGTIRVPLLIVRHDLLGVRLLTATSTEDLFTPVEGELLVVPRTLMPPNFNGRG